MDLIVFFSQSGHTKKLAQKIKETMKADIFEIKPAKEISGSKALVMLRGGFMASMKLKPKLRNDIDLNKYDRIIIGSPVWAGTFAPFVRTFLTNKDLSNRKAAFFATCLGGRGKVFDHFTKIIGDNANCVSKIEFITKDEQFDASMTKAEEWALNLLTM